jgi:DNA-binding CsgD family transcriptional regulator
MGDMGLVRGSRTGVAVRWGEGLNSAGAAPLGLGPPHELRDRMRAVASQLNSQRIASLSPGGREQAGSAVADLDRLSVAAMEVLEVAAVFGDGFSPDDLAAVLDEPVGRVLPALRETFDADVVIPRAHLALFHDEAVRHVVYAGIPEPIRLALHRRIGGLLLNRRGSALDAAAHLVEGARPGEPQDLPPLGHAARELIAASPAAAADLALLVLDSTDATDANRFPRTVTAVDALVAAKRISEATELARSVLAHPMAPAACLSQIHLTLATILLMSGEPEHVVAEAEATLADRESPDSVWDVAQLARLRALTVLDDVPRAQEAADEILAGRDRPGGDIALAAAVTALAWIAWDQGQIAVALGHVRAAVVRADRGGADRVFPRLSLAAMLTALGEFDDAETAIAQAADAAILTADTTYRMAPPLFMARLELAAGRLDAARAHAHEAVAIGTSRGIRLLMPLALATIAQIAMLRGDLRAASEHVDRCRLEVRPPSARLGAAANSWSEARLAECAEGRAAAMKKLDELSEWALAQPILLVEEPAGAASLIRAARAAGRHNLVEAIVAGAEQLAASNSEFPVITAAAAHARGLVDRDAELLREAASDYRHPWAIASAWEDAGAVALSAGEGDRDGARRAFERALAAYQRAGADRDAARVRSRLRDLGFRRCHWTRAERPASGWASLTDTERRVAHIVAEGLTNAQVAERLFLSRHTVDYHLRQIFRKLGIRSRVELTRVVVECAH